MHVSLSRWFPGITNKQNQRCLSHVASKRIEDSELRALAEDNFIGP